MIEPLIADRDPARIVKARAIVQAMSLFSIADRYLRSRLWWRRALALRALGLIQATDHTPQLVAALDDPHPDVRAAALDGLTDMHDLTALEAIVVRCTTLPCTAAGAARRSRRSDPSASRFCWSCRRSIRKTGSTTSTPSPSVARPGRGPSVPLDSRHPARGARDGL